MSQDKHCNVAPPPNDLTLLFPLPIQSGWTTVNTTPTPPHVLQVNLNDEELGVSRVSSGTTHKVCTLSDGVTKAWEAVYGKGSYNPSGKIRGGFGFYVQGPDQSEWRGELSGASEVMAAYAVRFQDGFEFVKGGKLPGIFGGEGKKAYGCTGGRVDDRCSCFDLRLMWRRDGQGELYAYIPITASNTRRLLAVPGSHQNPDYGFSVGRGSFIFTPGTWTTVVQRVKLNDPGQENGEIELWIDGGSVIKVTGLVLRYSMMSAVQGLHFQTFFGGSDSSWASPEEQRAWFTNVSGALMA